MATKLEQQRQQLARELDCCTSLDLRALARITPSTEEAWRKRGLIEYILFGNEYLYPKKGLAEKIQSLVRSTKAIPAKSVL